MTQTETSTSMITNTRMSPDFVKDAERERAEWLSGFDKKEKDVDDDEKGEFIRVDEAKIYIPKSLQSENIYN